MFKHQINYSKINLFLRSFVFSLFSLSMIVIYSLVAVFCFFLPLTKRHAIIRSFIVIYMAVLSKLCHINYIVEGEEHLAKMKGGIVLSKHQSTWETFFLPLIFKNPAMIAKRELLWVPFFGWGFAASDPITINRNNKTSAMQQIIKKGQLCLDAGRWVVFFPEGTRTAPGEIGKYHLGGARLATATGYKVVPVAHNAGRCWPRRTFIKRPGTIRVVIGAPIDPHNRTPEEVLQLAKDWIETTMVRIDSGLVDKPAS